MKVNIKGQVIRELRLRQVWTQEMLAELSGIHCRTIQRIENDGVASIRSLNALASVLDVEPGALQNHETRFQDTSQPQLLDSQGRMPGQLPASADQEIRPIRAFLQRAERLENLRTYEWAAWAILFIGGFLLVNVLLITQANLIGLNRSLILTIFFPGIAIGMMFLLIGGLGINLLKKFREQEIRLLDEWETWALLFAGGMLLVFPVILLSTTQANPNMTALLAVLFTCTAMGVLLLMLARGLSKHLFAGLEKKDIGQAKRFSFRSRLGFSTHT